MDDFSISLPSEICAELGSRARVRRIALNVSIDELANRLGVSSKTLGNFERTGRCTLETFIRILEVLNATSELQSVLATQNRSIEEMRTNDKVAVRQRAYRKNGSPK